MMATDTAMRVTTDAVQVLGGYGYTRDFPAERYMREAKVTQIFEGTNQIQRLVIARQLLRRGDLMRLTASDVVLVSGGASGLGAATVRARAAGARAVVLDLPAVGRGRAEQGSGTGSSAVTYATRPTCGRRSRWPAAGTLRAAVNCAGVATPGRVVGKRGTLPLDDFRRVIEINLVGTFNVLRLAANAMVGNDRPTATAA